MFFSCSSVSLKTYWLNFNSYEAGHICEAAWRLVGAQDNKAVIEWHQLEGFILTRNLVLSTLTSLKVK